MLDDTFGRVRGESRRAVWIGLAGILAILGVGWGTWTTLRRNAAENAAAQAANQRELQRAADEIAQSRPQLESLQSKIEQLQAELRQAQEQSRLTQEKTGKTIERLSAELRRKAAAPEPRPGTTSQAEDEFTLLKKQADQFITQERYADALQVARAMIRADAKRYEGYGVSGISMYFQKQYAEASDMLQQAAALAPQERKATLLNLARECQQLVGTPSR